MFKLSLTLLVSSVLGLVLLIGGYLVLAWPGTDDQLQLAGLKAPVIIQHDDAGVVHLQAAYRSDAWFALGALHARERLWQLEINRRIAQGRLSELFGPSTLPTDRFLRSLDLQNLARKQLRGASAALNEQLQAYADGVNAWVGQMKFYPPEFLLLKAWSDGPYFEVYRPEDAQAWSLVMALDLGGNHGQEIARFELTRHLSMAQLNALMPPVLTDLSAFYRDLAVYRPLGKQKGPHMQAVTETGFETFEGIGSNNWIVDGTRTASGKPLLANDPHLGLSAPSIWHIAHLRAPGLDVVGAVLVGIPAVVLGRNSHVAWGFTNTGPDVQDLMLEQLHPEDPSRYRIAMIGKDQESYTSFETRTEEIRVRGDKAETRVFRRSRHGPVISDVNEALQAQVDPSRYALALRWTALAEDNLSLEASIAMAQASNIEQLRDALRLYQAPAQNVVMADLQGDVAYQVAGLVPKRKEDRIAGVAPVPGWDPKFAWDGFLSFEQLPHKNRRAILAEGAVFATANEKPDHAAFLGHDFARRDRKDRITELLLKEERHTIDSMRSIQADRYSKSLDHLIKKMGRPQSKHPLHAKAWPLLEGFAGDMDRSSVGPSLAIAWVDALTRRILSDDLGAGLWSRHYGRRDFRTAIEHIVSTKDESWCDDRTTQVIESCAMMLALSWDDALDQLARRYGDNPLTWTWGRLHPAVSSHRPFSNMPGLSSLFELRVPSDGETYTINVGRLSLSNRDEPYRNQHAASLRFIFDLSSTEASRYVLQTGQSGWFFMPSYRNMNKEWADGRDQPLRMNPEAKDLRAQEQWIPIGAR
jgi:penicillin amidase